MKLSNRTGPVRGKSQPPHGMQALRPQCPCCAPRAEPQKPSQRLAERLAALRERRADVAE